ncbi:MAG: hypothetical protein QW745_07110 [Thermoplasmata archaeon]
MTEVGIQELSMNMYEFIFSSENIQTFADIINKDNNILVIVNILFFIQKYILDINSDVKEISEYFNNKLLWRDLYDKNR